MKFLYCNKVFTIHQIASSTSLRCDICVRSWHTWKTFELSRGSWTMLWSWVVWRWCQYFGPYILTMPYICGNNNVLFCSMSTFVSYNWCCIRVLVGSLCGINPLIVMIMVLVSSWIRVLIEVHEYVLNLSLLLRIHNHNNWWSRSAVVCVLTSWIINDFIASHIVWSVVSIERLWSWSGPCFLWGWLLLITHEVNTTETSTSRSLSLRLSLLLLWLLLWLLIMISVLGEVSMSRVWLMLLIIPVIEWSSSCNFYMLLNELLTQS